MSSIHISTDRPYDVIIERGLLLRTGDIAARLVKTRRAVLISDSHVMPLYGERTVQSLTRAGFSVERVEFPAGEASKNPVKLFELLSAFADLGLKRNDLLVALGGGVTGDLAGLAGSIYMRGMPVLQIPTSLLAMVDSSVGGKTAVNLPQGKNLVGTFSQPVTVLCDPDLLATLPKGDITNGWGEIIKYAMLKKDVLLPLLEKESIDDNILLDIISECVTIKRDIVTADEFETGTRALLNFGHTIGHAIEVLSSFSIPHGAAVAIGMGIITRMAVLNGTCSPETEIVLQRLTTKFNLPSTCPENAKEISAMVRTDKKCEKDSIKLIWPTAVGHCIIRKMPFDEFELRLTEALQSMKTVLSS